MGSNFRLLYLPLEKKKENKIFWISNDKSIQKTHKWRSEESAILVGVQTVIVMIQCLQLENGQAITPHD